MRVTLGVLFAALLFAAFLPGAPTVVAQPKHQMLGPNECLNCHDHAAEREWYEKKEIPEVRRLFPDRGAKAGHINSLNQLEASKSDDYAKAIGLADKYDVKGKCVACHATVYRGDANAGVSCESCHGPGSGYLKPHQTKGSYDIAVAQYGMTRLIGNIQGWTQQCSNCHVMDDDRLIKAGHPSGDDFDLSKKFVPVSLHFKKTYTEADVAAIARPQREAILRLRRNGYVAEEEAAVPVAPAAAEPTLAAPPAAPPSAAIAATPSIPAPVAAEPAPRVAAPAPAAPVAPRRVVRRPAPAVPWSPTSIEPRVPVEAVVAVVDPTPATVTAPAAPAPRAATPEPLPPAEAPIPTLALVLGGLAIVFVLGGLAGLFWWLGRRSSSKR